MLKVRKQLLVEISVVRKIHVDEKLTHWINKSSPKGKSGDDSKIEELKEFLQKNLVLKKVCL